MGEEPLQDASCYKTKSQFGEVTMEDRKDIENCLPEVQPSVVFTEGPC